MVTTRHISVISSASIGLANQYHFPPKSLPFLEITAYYFVDWII